MRYRPLIAVAASVAAADALTKAIAAVLFRRVRHLPDGWALRVVHNNGAFLGLGAGTKTPDVAAVVGAVVIAFAAFYTRHNPGPLRAVALGLILGAYIGNVGESRLTGHAVDWIRTPHLTPHLYFTFDLADVAAVCGQVLLIVLMVSASRPAPREAVA